MATQTPNYNFQLPEDGGDDAQWGAFLNANWSSIDTLLQDANDAIAANAAAITQLQQDLDKARIQVGQLYLSTTDDDPAVTLGYGTWAAYAIGRAIVGVGNNGESDWTPGQGRGAEVHTLTLGQMPSHGHGNTLAVASGGGQAHSVPGAILNGNGAGDLGTSFVPAAGFGFKTGSTTSAAVQHTHGLTGSITPNGSGDPHNNIQPSVAVYVWQRTA